MKECACGNSICVCIDQDECIGCQACIDVCPDIFTFNESTGTVMVLKSDVDDKQCVQEAIELCPVNCIEIEE